MLKINNKKQIEEYFENTRISQSTLKKYRLGLHRKIKNPKRKLYKEDKSYFRLGNIVDIYLTGAKDEIEESIYIMIEDKPSELICSIVQKIYDDCGDIKKDLKDHPELILNTLNEHGYQKNWGDKTRLNKIINLGTDYFKILCESNNKMIVSSEESATAVSIIENFKNSERTKKYLDRKKDEKEANLISHYQIPIYFTYRDLECKSLLDKLEIKIIDDDTIEVTPIDIKTSLEAPEYFFENLIEYGYHIQAAFYTEAVKYYISKNYTHKNIKINNFIFLVSSTKYLTAPAVAFQLRTDLLNLGYEKMTDLVENYKYYQETDFKEDIRFKDKDLVQLGLDWIKDG